VYNRLNERIKETMRGTSNLHRLWAAIAMIPFLWLPLALATESEPGSAGTEIGSTVDHPADVQQFPYPLAPIEFAYPENAGDSAAHYIICQAIIDSTGRLHTALALGCEGDKGVLCDEILAVLPDVPFAPARRDGQPVSSSVVFSATFRAPNVPVEVGVPVVDRWYEDRCAYTGRIYGSAELAPEDRPFVIEASPPVYPQAARIAGIPGRALLKAVIGPDGVPCFVLCESASPGGAGFAEAALRAASEYRYRPGLIDGEPQAVWVEIPFYWDP
jgi:hypothetical protein